MEGPVDRLGRLEVGDRDVQDDPPALGQLDGPALRVGLVAVAQRPRPGTAVGTGADTGVDSHGGPAAAGDSQGGRIGSAGPRSVDADWRSLRSVNITGSVPGIPCPPEGARG